MENMLFRNYVLLQLPILWAICVWLCRILEGRIENNFSGARGSGEWNCRCHIDDLEIPKSGV